MYKHFKSPGGNICLVFFFTTGYACIRYNLGKSIPWSDFPLYVMNKSLAWSSVVLLLFTVLYVKEKSMIKFYGKNAFLFAILHVISSVILFSEEYYENFFTPLRKLNLLGSFFIMSGVLSFMLMRELSQVKREAEKVNLFYGKKTLICVLNMIHLVLLGYFSWTEFGKWPYGMPPISLWSFIIVLFTALLLTKRLPIGGEK